MDTFKDVKMALLKLGHGSESVYSLLYEHDTTQLRAFCCKPKAEPPGQGGGKSMSKKEMAWNRI